MKNHTNDCTVVTQGKCSCSFENQPGKDIAVVLNDRADQAETILRMERECDHYLDKIADLYAENAELVEENKAIAEYPWGHQWTYWFTAMIAGGAAIVGLIVATWMLQ